MPTDNGRGVVRFDINDPEDMARLIATGIVWKGGPDAIEAAIEYLQDHPEAINSKVPPAVLSELDFEDEPEPVADDELDMAPPAGEELPEEEAPLAPPAP